MPVLVSVPLTPGALYAVVFVAVKAGVVTKAVTVTAPLTGGDVAEAVADRAVPESASKVIEVLVADDGEACEVESEVVADAAKIN